MVKRLFFGTLRAAEVEVAILPYCHFSKLPFSFIIIIVLYSGKCVSSTVASMCRLVIILFLIRMNC